MGSKSQTSTIGIFIDKLQLFSSLPRRGKIRVAMGETHRKSTIPIVALSGHLSGLTCQAIYRPDKFHCDTMFSDFSIPVALSQKTKHN
jgi:hypothetical protein